MGGVGGDFGGGADGDAIVAFGVGVGDIRLYLEKKPRRRVCAVKGPRRMVCAATAKSLGASSRSYQKMNYGYANNCYYCYR